MRDDCITYEGPLNKDGYPGHVWRNGVRKSAYRWAYEDVHGPVPEGLQIDHVCNNTRCVNPSHLGAVTFAENMRRRGQRQTACKNGHPRTPENVYVWGRRNWTKCRVCMTEAQRRYLARKAAA